MTKPEQGGMTQEEETTNPLERVKKAIPSLQERNRMAREIAERLSDVEITGKNLGIAVSLAGKLECIVQFVEKYPEDEFAEYISYKFESIEKIMEKKAPGDFPQAQIAEWIDKTFNRIQKIEGESKEK